VSGESERVREKKKKANIIIWATTRGVVGTAQDHIVIHTGAESKASPTGVVVSGARNARMSDKVFIFPSLFSYGGGLEDEGGAFPPPIFSDLLSPSFTLTSARLPVLNSSFGPAMVFSGPFRVLGPEA